MSFLGNPFWVGLKGTPRKPTHFGVFQDKPAPLARVSTSLRANVATLDAFCPGLLQMMATRRRFLRDDGKRPDLQTANAQVASATGCVRPPLLRVFRGFVIFSLRTLAETTEKTGLPKLLTQAQV